MSLLGDWLRQWRESLEQEPTATPVEPVALVAPPLHMVARVVQMARMNQQQLAQAKLASMKELAYGASHEVNNPLANIATRAQVLLRDEPDPDRQRKLAMIEQQAMRAHEMIANMMYFAHPPQPTWRSVSINQIVTDVGQEFTDRFQQQGIQFHWQAPSDERPIVADATQLRLALELLFENALEALNPGDQVHVTTQQTLDTSTIRIGDNGPGVSLDQQAHLFDPFFSGREAGRGLGLGLSKAWRIAELHQGQLRFRPGTEGGAVFELSLPINRAQSASQVVSDDSPSQQPPNAA